jgi:hypothetical protein
LAVLGKLADVCGATACVGSVDPVRRERPGRRLRTVKSTDQDPRKRLADASAAWFTDLDGSQPDAWCYLVDAETDNGADEADYR